MIFDIKDNMFLREAFAKNSCTFALAILKVYLVLYRLQNIKNSSADNLMKLIMI